MKEFLDIFKYKGRQIVTIIDPHLKVDENYEIYTTLKNEGLLVLDNNCDKNYIGSCWPGKSSWADFINFEKITHFYKKFYQNEKYFLESDNFHTWNDMNEPAVFNIIDKVMPKTCYHFDGERYIQSFEIHNIYGYMQHKVTYESLKFRYKNKIRPFVLSRSFYAGSQQYGFIWTVDNRSNWEFMKSSIDTMIGIAICGYSAVGADIGGFFGTPSEELLRAWFALGAFNPFFRGHSHMDSIRREPWLFSEETLNSIIDSITLRYHLLLFWYTKYYDHSIDGVPIIKPLWLRFQNLFEFFAGMDNSHFAIGEEFIIVPYLKMNK